jgi:hypothetical protein
VNDSWADDNDSDDLVPGQPQEQHGTRAPAWPVPVTGPVQFSPIDDCNVTSADQCILPVVLPVVPPGNAFFLHSRYKFGLAALQAAQEKATAAKAERKKIANASRASVQIARAYDGDLQWHGGGALSAATINKLCSIIDNKTISADGYPRSQYSRAQRAKHRHGRWQALAYVGYMLRSRPAPILPPGASYGDYVRSLVK